MRVLLLTSGWIALSGVFGSAPAVAAQADEQPVTLPNAADPKPTSAGAEGAAQAVVISLERIPAASAKLPQSDQGASTPGKHSGKPAPFRKPKRN